jgi:hypothetical protein
VRAGAQEPRRAADGGRPSSAPGWWKSRAAPWGARRPRPPSHEVRGRSLALLAGAAWLALHPSLHVRQHPPPASTPHADEHVEVQRPPEQLCPVHSRRPLLHPLLPGRYLKPRARLLRTCLREWTLAPGSRSETLFSAAPLQPAPPWTGYFPAIGSRVLLRTREEQSSCN